MYRRWRASGAGAAVLAAAGILLTAAPAQADCGNADAAAGQAPDQTAAQRTQAARWQIGLKLGPAPVFLTGAGGLPALLLSATPVTGVAVENAYGQNLVSVDAANTSTLADTAAVPRTQSLRENLDVAKHSAAVRLAPTDRVRTAATAATPAAAAAPARAAQKATASSAPVQWEVLQAGGADSALGGPFTWVPIESVTGFGTDGESRPWATGVGLVVLAGGAAAVSVARRGRVSAG